MAVIRYITAAGLIGILVTANFAMLKQFEWNGSWNLDDILVYSNRVLPNTDIPIRLPQTGIPAVDNYFAFMTAFFYTTLDVRNYRAHLQGNHLLGTLTSIWTVMLVEAHGGASSTFSFLTYFLEVMGELLGIGLFTPIWCLVHLSMTGPPSKPTPSTVSSSKLRALGYALIAGHAIPSVLMLRTEPDGEGLASQQLWTIIRLFHPVLVFGSWKLFSPFLPSSPATDFFASKRKLYQFSILASAFFHVTSLGFLLAKTMLPNWLREEVVLGLDWKTVIVPVPFWGASASAAVAWETSVAMFLQWDYICSSAAATVWAAGLYLEAAGTFGWSELETFAQSGLVTVLAGPAAAAAFLMQERDGVLKGREQRRALKKE